MRYSNYKLLTASCKRLSLSLFIFIFSLCFFSCSTNEGDVIGIWIIPGHSHYFDLREDGGYEITGVDGYRETGEWEATEGTVLLRNRLGTDTLWYSENGNSVQLEELKNGATISLNRSTGHISSVDGEAVVEFLMADTLAFYTPGGTIESTPVFFHEDAMLDLATREQKLWRLKQFRNEWFLGTEAFSVMEYSRIVGLSDKGLELEYLDRRSYSLRKTYLRAPLENP